MIQVQKIEFTRAEGSTGAVGHPIVFAGSDAWTRTNAYVAVAAKSAPPPRSYDKCDVVVTWEDGTRYAFRFDMSRDHSHAPMPLSYFLNAVLAYDEDHKDARGPAARRLRNLYDLGLLIGAGAEPRPTLRPAADLAREHDARRAKQQDKTDVAGLDRAAAAIEKAHAAGKRETTEMTFSHYVVLHLRDAGYTVRLNGACGMGDVSSHTISW